VSRFSTKEGLKREELMRIGTTPLNILKLEFVYITYLTLRRLKQNMEERTTLAIRAS